MNINEGNRAHGCTGLMVSVMDNFVSTFMSVVHRYIGVAVSTFCVRLLYSEYNWLPFILQLGLIQLMTSQQQEVLPQTSSGPELQHQSTPKSIGCSTQSVPLHLQTFISCKMIHYNLNVWWTDRWKQKRKKEGRKEAEGGGGREGGSTSNHLKEGIGHCQTCVPRAATTVENYISSVELKFLQKT